MLAAGLVKQIQAGCDLYREAKTQFVQIKKTGEDVAAIYTEVTGFWNNFSNFFKSKKKTATPNPVAKKKEKFVA